MLVIIAASASVASAQQKRDEVTFALNWLPVGEAAGWYVALDKGYFKENNIDVNIVRGFGSGDTAKRVAAKRAQFGVADIGTVILLRINEGIKVTAVGMFFGRAPHAVFFRASSGIKTPKDLEGEKHRLPRDECQQGHVPGVRFAGQDRCQQDRVEDHGTGRRHCDLCEPADLVCEFLTSRPNVVAQSREPISQFIYADYGFNIYANAVIAQEDTIKQNPDLVRRFVKAAMRGLEYASKILMRQSRF